LSFLHSSETQLNKDIEQKEVVTKKTTSRDNMPVIEKIVAAAVIALPAALLRLLGLEKGQ
jgi:hypothetical protein